MSASLDAVLDKVRKLRGLATSSNVHEAAAAAAAADRLIQEHGLSEAQLEAEGVRDGEKPAQADDPLVSWGKVSPAWLGVLAVRLSKHFDCTTFTYRGHNDRGEIVLNERIVGRPSDVETVRYFFAWLSVEIERLAQATTKLDPPASMPKAKTIRIPRGRRWLNSFRHGAVHGVMSAMEEAKARARAAAQDAGASAAIVLVDARLAAADALMRKMHPELRATSIKGRIDARAFGEGREAGRRINRDAHLTGASAKALPAGAR